METKKKGKEGSKYRAVGHGKGKELQVLKRTLKGYKPAETHHNDDGKKPTPADKKEDPPLSVRDLLSHYMSVEDLLDFSASAIEKSTTLKEEFNKLLLIKQAERKGMKVKRLGPSINIDSIFEAFEDIENVELGEDAEEFILTFYNEEQAAKFVSTGKKRIGDHIAMCTLIRSPWPNANHGVYIISPPEFSISTNAGSLLQHIIEQLPRKEEDIAEGPRIITNHVVHVVFARPAAATVILNMKRMTISGHELVLQTNKPTINVEEWQKLVESLEKTCGMFIKKIAADGNCLFRALADQLEGTDENHMDYRCDVAKYLMLCVLTFSGVERDDLNLPSDDELCNKIKSDYGDGKRLV